MTSAWTYLTQGNIFQAFLQTYVDIGIPNGFLYLFLMAVFCSLLYIRTKSPGMVAMMLMLFGGAVVTIQSSGMMDIIRPDSLKYFSAMILIGIAYTLYSVYRELT